MHQRDNAKHASLRGDKHFRYTDRKNKEKTKKNNGLQIY